ncbi:MAG: hypothetical protein JXX14_01205 [Deltaproteobacteria bacterium]|nr:hypothetical protein [Deltaproteobacteria bacterium]
MTQRLIFIAAILALGCGVVSESEIDDTQPGTADSQSPDTVADGTDSGTSLVDTASGAASDTDAPTPDSGTATVLPDFSAMTRAEIEDYARNVPGAVSGCSGDDSGPCTLSFLSQAICSRDGYIIAPTGECDEGGQSGGSFCSPAISSCLNLSTTRCGLNDAGRPALFASVGECAVVAGAATCQLGEEQFVMDCDALVGTRYCDEQRLSVWEVLEAECSDAPVNGDDGMPSEPGCVRTLSEKVIDCGEGDRCNGGGTWIHVNGSGDDPRGPSLTISFQSTALCEEAPCPYWQTIQCPE